MTVLLDSNVLIALLIADHVHHDGVERWLARKDEPFATCPITEGSVIRLVLREGGSARDATGLLVALAGNFRHRFWPDDRAYAEVPLRGVIGHRQVTDAYLAHLARSNQGRLATMDAGLAEAQRDVVEFVKVT